MILFSVETIVCFLQKKFFCFLFWYCSSDPESAVREKLSAAVHQASASTNDGSVQGRQISFSTTAPSPPVGPVRSGELKAAGSAAVLRSVYWILVDVSLWCF